LATSGDFFMATDMGGPRNAWQVSHRAASGLWSCRVSQKAATRLPGRVRHGRREIPRNRRRRVSASQEMLPR
jgi:hypothetical protein